MIQSFEKESLENRILSLHLFDGMLQNEQQKAIQAIQSFLSGKDFGGTSVSSLIRRPNLDSQIEPKSYEELAERIAGVYVDESRDVFEKLDNGFVPGEVELFKEHGVFYGVHVSPKLVGLTEGLVVEHEDLLLDGFPEPYSLPKESREVIEGYFSELRKQKGFDIKLSSLVLADTTTPRGYEGKRILNPCDLNEKLTQLSRLTTQAIRDRGESVDDLYFLSTDSDSPHRILITEGRKPIRGYPFTPGLTMCGSTATIEGFDFKYAYRLGLVAQGISNNIIGSKMSGEYNPFMFVGMLSPFGYINGAIPTGKMGELRYPGDIDLKKEFLFQYEQDLRKMMD